MYNDALQNTGCIDSVEEAHLALDCLYARFTSLLDDLDLAEAIAQADYEDLIVDLITIRNACLDAREQLATQPLEAVLPMVRAMLSAALATYAFVEKLSPAALVLARNRRGRSDQLAAARAAAPRAREKALIDKAISAASDAREAAATGPWTGSRRGLALKLLPEVNARLAAEGVRGVEVDAVSKRLARRTVDDPRPSRNKSLTNTALLFSLDG